MKYISFVCFALLLVVSACKKSKVETVNTNNSKDSLTYQPKVPGSKWTYEMTVLTNKTTYHVTRLDYDTMINGKTYNVFDSETEGLQFIRQDGNKYYSVLTAAANKTELNIIDVDKNVPDTWIGGVNGSDTYSYTMYEKIPVYILDGFTFKNVLKIYQERKDGGGNVTLSGVTWYAQGIGQIQSEGTVAGINVKVKLISVDLK